MEKFKELWANPRSKAIIKLGAWFVFLIAIVIFSAFSSTSNFSDNNKYEEEKTKVVFNSLNDMKNNLLTKNYKYIYKLYNKTDKELTIYSGSVNGLEEAGYYESNKEIYKYLCSDKCYKVFTDHQEEMALSRPVKNKLEILFEDLKNITLKEEENKDIKIYSYNSMDENSYKEIKITTSVSEITSIHIVTDAETYDIDFEY